MLQNAYFLATFGFDTAENERATNLPKKNVVFLLFLRRNLTLREGKNFLHEGYRNFYRGGPRGRVDAAGAGDAAVELGRRPRGRAGPRETRYWEAPA